MTSAEILEFAKHRRLAAQAAIDFHTDEKAACEAHIAALMAEDPGEEEPEDGEGETPPIEDEETPPNEEEPGEGEGEPGEGEEGGEGEPTPDPDPVPKPDPVPAPIPGGGPVGSRTLGRDITTCRDAGVVITSDLVTITQALPDFSDWDLGGRRLIFQARVGHVADIRSVSRRSDSLPSIHCQPGGGFDVSEFITSLDCDAFVFKQENGGLAKVIRQWDMREMRSDPLKVHGGNLIEGCRIGPAKHHGGLPHADVLTAMSAEGGIIFRNNDVDWRYSNTGSDQTGINGLFRIETYPAASNVWDDIVIDNNRLRQANPRSFAMQVVEKGSPTWRGSIKVRNNKIEKAGGNAKIYYGSTPSPRITEWTGNTDFAGAAIPLSAI